MDLPESVHETLADETFRGKVEQFQCSLPQLSQNIGGLRGRQRGIKTGRGNATLF